MSRRSPQFSGEYCAAGCRAARLQNDMFFLGTYFRGRMRDVKKIGVVFFFITSLAYAAEQSEDSNEMAGAAGEVAIQMNSANGDMQEIQGPAGEAARANAVNDVNSVSLLSADCANRLLRMAGYTECDDMQLSKALKGYQEAAGNWKKDPKNNAQKRARELILQVQKVMATDERPENRIQLCKATTSDNPQAEQVNVQLNQNVTDIQQLIQKIMSDQITQLTQQNNSSQKKTLGLSVSTVIGGCTTAAFLITWLLQKKCSCQSSS